MKASPTLSVERAVLVSRNIQSVASVQSLLKALQIGCANCVGVLWLCSSLMICSSPLTRQASESWLLPNCTIDLKFGQQAKILLLFLGLFLLSGPDRGAQNWVWRPHRNEDILFFGSTPGGSKTSAWCCKEHCSKL